MGDLGKGLPEQLLLGVAQHLAEGAVHLREAEVGPDDAGGDVRNALLVHAVSQVSRPKHSLLNPDDLFCEHLVAVSCHWKVDADGGHLGKVKRGAGSVPTHDTGDLTHHFRERVLNAGLAPFLIA